MIQTSVGIIPSPYNWAHSTMHQDSEILFLEKATDGRVTLEEIAPALDEYKRLFKAGIASPAEILTFMLIRLCLKLGKILQQFQPILMEVLVIYMIGLEQRNFLLQLRNQTWM